MPTYHDEGVCVRHWDWSETSQTVMVLTRNHGLLRCVAKGSKREKAPFSGGVELLTRAGLTVIIKPSAEMAQLTSWDLLEPMPLVRRDHARYAAATYCVDLVPRLVHDHDPHPGLYDALAATLGAIGGADGVAREAIPAWLAWLQWRLLDETGSKPEVALDVRTGEDLAETDPVGFAWDLGGLVRVGRGGAAGPGVGRIRPGTAAVLRRLDAGAGPDGLLGTPDDTLRAGRVLAARIRALMGAEPPALAWVYPEIAAGRSE